jgi:hypothetical protein
LKVGYGRVVGDFNYYSVRPFAEIGQFLYKIYITIKAFDLIRLLGTLGPHRNPLLMPGKRPSVPQLKIGGDIFNVHALHNVNLVTLKGYSIRLVRFGWMLKLHKNGLLN